MGVNGLKVVLLSLIFFSLLLEYLPLARSLPHCPKDQRHSPQYCQGEGETQVLVSFVGDREGALRGYGV